MMIFWFFFPCIQYTPRYPKTHLVLSNSRWFPRKSKLAAMLLMRPLIPDFISSYRNFFPAVNRCVDNSWNTATDHQTQSRYCWLHLPWIQPSQPHLCLRHDQLRYVLPSRRRSELSFLIKPLPSFLELDGENESPACRKPGAHIKSETSLNHCMYNLNTILPSVHILDVILRDPIRAEYLIRYSSKTQTWLKERRFYRSSRKRAVRQKKDRAQQCAGGWARWEGEFSLQAFIFSQHQ